MNTLALARAQFGANISFHILFPSITIALAWFLLFFKVMSSRSAQSAESWGKIYKFWVRIFSLCFALGIVSGVTMSFQFGTNWPGFMNKVGNIAGPLLAYEVLTAFFLEATFLGVMLFGSNRVCTKIHIFSVFMVAFGTTLSAFWILSLISWMHTPTGFEMRNDIAHAVDWIKIVFNPSMPVRFTHMLLASGITASFFIAGLSAYRFLRNDNGEDVMLALKSSIYAGLILCTLQIFVGDQHGLNTLHNQPRKIAAMEGIWETEKGAAFRVFAVPNKDTKSNDFEIKIPYMSSIILTHSLDGEVKGLNDFEDAPPVLPVFFSFRVMVGLGFFMLATLSLATFELIRKKTLGKISAHMLKYMTFSGLIATLAGWYTTEIGRQPWLVEGILKTKDAVSEVAANMVASTFIGYLSIYIFMLIAFISTIFYMARRAQKIIS